MSAYDLTVTEKKRRNDICEHTRNMVLSNLNIEAQDETSVMTGYRGYYLQISFSRLHPLMVFCLARQIACTNSHKQLSSVNELNLKSILGSHCVNEDAGCYAYRATQWLDTELGSERFFEILDRCVDEADKGYARLAV